MCIRDSHYTECQRVVVVVLMQVRATEHTSERHRVPGVLLSHVGLSHGITGGLREASCSRVREAVVGSWRPRQRLA